MEITIDIGADTLHSLNKIAEMNSTELSVTAAEMLSFGSRIYLQSLEKRQMNRLNYYSKIVFVQYKLLLKFYTAYTTRNCQKLGLMMQKPH